MTTEEQLSELQGGGLRGFWSRLSKQQKVLWVVLPILGLMVIVVVILGINASKDNDINDAQLKTEFQQVVSTTGWGQPDDVTVKENQVEGLVDFGYCKLVVSADLDAIKEAYFTFDLEGSRPTVMVPLHDAAPNNLRAARRDFDLGACILEPVG